MRAVLPLVSGLRAACGSQTWEPEGLMRHLQRPGTSDGGLQVSVLIGGHAVTFVPADAPDAATVGVPVTAPGPGGDAA